MFSYGRGTPASDVDPENISRRSDRPILAWRNKIQECTHAHRAHFSSNEAVLIHVIIREKELLSRGTSRTPLFHFILEDTHS